LIIFTARNDQGTFRLFFFLKVQALWLNQQNGV
jgi:hypothetical protein